MLDAVDEATLTALTVPPDKLRMEIRKRSSSYVLETIHPEPQEKYEADGWELDRELKRSVKMRRPKPSDIAFEDEVWTTFAKLGFETLNKDRNFKVRYGKGDADEQQVDVFAADNESVLVVECKATAGDPKKSGFKKEIEALGGMRAGIIRSLRNVFPDHKVKFIFATKGYSLPRPSIKRLTSMEIAYFDEDVIEYYVELSKHLGLAARFQLLGFLFAGQKIPGMQNQVPAIRGKMGRHTYYSFSIEPEKLLKVGYVSHRNRANSNLMPTYQRLIKRSRLRSVTSFVESGNFFPNSVIINLQTGDRGPRFDLAAQRVEGTDTRLGVLHLPQNYRSAYIIDGQHRLYGYAESGRAGSDAIPVVAFVNLDRSEQVRLFMQINENQKAVPKNLRNTLNADLLWDSDDRREQIKALKLQLAQHLGEQRSSPLYGRVIVGETPRTTLRCITIDAIRIGFDRGNFFGTFTSTDVEEAGTFYKGANQPTFDALVPYIEGCFGHLREFLPDQWDIGSGEEGFIFINAGIESLLRIFSDIMDHLVSNKAIIPMVNEPEEMIQESMYYLDPLISFLDELPAEQRLELRRGYGTGGRVRYWRTLQQAINRSRPEFSPEGMQEYWKEEAKLFNIESIAMIRDIETFMKEDIRTRLQGKYGNRWLKDGVPPGVHKDLVNRAFDKNRERDESQEVEPWDCLYIVNYRDIASYNHATWTELFERRYTKPGEEKKKGGWKARTDWMVKLNTIRNENFHTYSVKEEEYEFLRELTEWLIEGRVDNDLD